MTRDEALRRLSDSRPELESIARIGRYTAGLDATSFAADQLIVDAVLRNFTLIGKAARHVPDAIVDRYPDIPWAEMRGLRNIPRRMR